jgi:aminocarboxymuconate-semialdehyde decarboxylase
VPDEFLHFVEAEDAFAIKIKRRETDHIILSFGASDLQLSSTFFSMDQQETRLTDEGIDRTILSLATPFINYHIDGNIAARGARIFNDGLASAIALNSAKFGGWGYLPMQNPEAAGQELRRCVEEHGFVGGHIASNIRGVYLDNEQFEPVFRAAASLGVPLFVHPADPLGKERMTDFELTIVAGYLFDSTVNILRLICSGFFDRWPTLKLVFAHTGAFSTILRARMQREVDTNPRLGRTLNKPIGDYLKHIYADTVCFEPEILRYAASVIPVENLLLGSDAPFPLGEPDPVNFVRKALPAAQAQSILDENFERLTREM